MMLSPKHEVLCCQDQLQSVFRLWKKHNSEPNCVTANQSSIGTAAVCPSNGLKHLPLFTSQIFKELSLSNELMIFAPSLENEQELT